MEEIQGKWAPERKVPDFIDLLQKEAVATSWLRKNKTAHKPYDSGALSGFGRADRLDKDQMADVMTHSLSFCCDRSARYNYVSWMSV